MSKRLHLSVLGMARVLIAGLALGFLASASVYAKPTDVGVEQSATAPAEQTTSAPSTPGGSPAATELPSAPDTFANNVDRLYVVNPSHPHGDDNLPLTTYARMTAPANFIVASDSACFHLFDNVPYAAHPASNDLLKGERLDTTLIGSPAAGTCGW